VSSATATPQNSSPTSPLGGDPHPNPFGVQARQLRPPKSPLYIPAVLRPTDPPRRLQRPSTSITPPRSANGSLDSLSSLKPLSRMSTADSLGKISEHEWSLGLPEITNLPTRKHWKVRWPCSVSFCVGVPCAAASWIATTNSSEPSSVDAGDFCPWLAT
jgi:hypothetical protein